MKELGFGTASLDLRRYREDEPASPPALATMAVRWTKDPAFVSPQYRPTRVAEQLPEEDEKDYETRRLEGETSPPGGHRARSEWPARYARDCRVALGLGRLQKEPIPAGPSKTPNKTQ